MQVILEIDEFRNLVDSIRDFPKIMEELQDHQRLISGLSSQFSELMYHQCEIERQLK